MKAWMRSTILISSILFTLAARAATTPPGGTDIVINEIMYHPFHTAAQAEDTGREWIELFNRGTNAVNLQNWRLSKGIDFTFSNITFLEPGAFLVVTASRTNFLAQYPAVTNVAGDWTGRLGNTDDEVRLLNPQGDEVDAVKYADGGDWAVRTRVSADAYGLRGWDWLAPHDGDGASLELINASMPNHYGQNWAAGTVNGGTPGAANSVVAGNTAPFIQEVSHFPLVPRSTESVTVKARVEDEATEGMTATLFYRNASSASPPGFSSVAMFDDGNHADGLPGDGVFAGAISTQTNGAIIEFYVAASDSEGRTRTWPAPSLNAPDLGGAVLPPAAGANALYQVDDTAYTGTQPLYRMIMTETERAFLASISGNARNSDASANGTFLSIDPNTTEVHHLTSYRRRGAGSRGAAIPNYRVNFATDNRWKDVTGVNLNSQYPHAQVAGSVMAALSGLNAEFQKPVQVRVNGVNLLRQGSPNSYAQQEVPDGDYAKRHFPDDSNGNIYRASSGSHSTTLSYLGTNGASYLSTGYSKTSNGAENDWSDLINLTDILNNTLDANYVAAARQRLNVEQWMIYFSVFTLLDSRETSLGIGNGDDFGMYRGLIDTRFQLLGHDFDTIFSQGDTAGNVNDGIFRATAVAVVDRFLKRPEFAPIYFRTLTNLIVTAFSQASVSATLNQHLGSWVSGGVISNMISFSGLRNAGVLAQIPLTNTITHPLAAQGGYPRTTVADVSLTGLANAISTRSVRVNGAVAVWSAWEARWNATVTLTPGVNRVFVQALDENGNEFERSYIDIWYDHGVAPTDLSGTLSENTILTAANGPYQLTANLVVPDEIMLTIEPGARIYVAPGVTITVRATGRILAQGTEAQHIRIGRNPNVAGNWGSLDFISAGQESVLAYVDFDSCGGTTIDGHNAQIHVNNGSVVKFSHCTWPPTPVVEYISFDGSSFIVENCIFPTYPGPTGPEMLHGVNGIGSHGIFRENYFGHTWGFNDTIDFTGGQRPGAILQIIGNIFDGATDDHLDLDSTDAWIEGNIFMHAHRDPTRTDDARDTASAISGGVDVAGQFSEWTVINNLFYDVDHAILNKGAPGTPGAGRFIFVNNTLVHVAKEWGAGLATDIAAFDFTDDGVPLPAPEFGAGAFVANNIIWDASMLTANYNAANHTVLFVNNLLSSAWTGPGSNNVVADPRLNLSLITNPTNANWKTVQAALTPRPGSPAIENGYGAKYDRGGLNPRGLLLYGEPRGTTTVNTATLTVAPGGTFNWGTNAYPWGYTQYKWKLDNGPWSAPLPITTQPIITLSNLSNGAHTVYVSGRNDAGYYQDDPFVYPTNGIIPAHVSASRTWVVDTTLEPRVVINEILARNVAAVAVDGKYPDLIELYNAGTAPVDLSTMSLTDDPSQPRKFIFPAGTTIGGGAYLILHAATGESAGRQYLGFSLQDSGEGVYLYDKPANGGALLDGVTFGIQIPDFSIGRVSDGTWKLTIPTLGSANIPQPTADPKRLKINEWLAAPGSVFHDDFIELYNPEPVPAPLSGLALSESPMSSPRMSVIPPLSFIAGSGWQTFIADGDALAGADHVNFKLSAEWGWISLANTNGTLIDMIAYATQVPDISVGRRPDGTSGFLSFNQPTPGGGNPGQTIIITPVTTTLVPMTQTWRMEASGTDLGTAWRANNYNDSAWSSGAALFYNFDGTGTQNPPIPANTVVPFTNPKQTTVYFRSTFNYTGPTNGLAFVLSQVIDDGCVLYLNNQEIYRFGFAEGAVITYNSRPASVGGGPPLLTGIPVTINNLVAGTNYLTIEVHQQSATSSDIAMAVQLDAQRFVTNFLNTPIVLSEVFTKNTSYTNASGKIVDWVELFNPSTNVIDISDLSLTDDTARPRRWAFPPGAQIAPGSYYVVEFDDSAPYSPVNAGFELSADSGAVYVYNRPAAGGGLLDSVVYGVQVADLTLGRAVAGQNTSWALCQPTRAASNVAVPLGSPNLLRVNEWMPNPANNDDDWFEIYNPGALPVSLGGLHLTDDTSTATKHTVRAFSYLGVGPEGFLKFIADDDISKGADHVAFKLSNTAEEIAIYTSNAVPTLINRISYSNVVNNVSQGRLPDGGTNIVYFTNSASPEAANWLPLLNSVVINELLARPGSQMEQAIELWNPSEVDVSIGGWFLSNARKDLKRFMIPPGTILSAGSFKVFYENQFNPGHDVPPSFAFNFSNDDELHLSVADGNGNLTGYRTSVDFNASAPGVSFGRFEKSTGDDFVAMKSRTFGVGIPSSVEQFRLGEGRTNSAPIVGPIVINEIHYHPPEIGTNDNVADEYIELLNTAAFAIQLYDPAYPTNVWRLRNGVDFDFATNMTIPAGGYVLVVSFNPTNTAALDAFRTKYSLAPSATIVGPYSGKLDNSSDAIELQRFGEQIEPPAPDAGRVPRILVERVKYSDAAPWPAAADGNTNGLGVSLQRRVSNSYGNEATNWIAALPTPGAPNGPAVFPTPTINSGPSNIVVSAGSNVTFTVAASAVALTYQWRFNGDSIPNATNTSYTIFNAQAAKAGKYSVLVANPWGAALGGPARLSVQSPPQVVQQPLDRTVPQGANATFTVTGSGGSLSYQWLYFGTNLPGATSPALTFTNVTIARTGPYSVVLSNTFGSITSSVATLTVLVPPSITGQPQNLDVIVFNSAAFTVSATGTLPLSYQWRFNGVNISNATGASFNIGTVLTNHAGNYTVVITNLAGSITSSVATLTVIVPPTVTVVASDPTASEPGANTGTFTFTRNGDDSADLVVNYSVSGSAGPGSDYTALSGTVTILAGSASATVLVTPLDDTALEGDETVIVSLTSSTNYLNGNPSNATVLIFDNDNVPPIISITSPPENQVFLYTPTNVDITVTVEDPDGTIGKVEFFANATNKLGESVTAPFNFTWTNAPAGSNALTARATDNLGSTAVSVPVNIVLNAAPIVGILNPVNGSTFAPSFDIPVVAFAGDADGRVTQVNFYANGFLIGTSTNLPFSATLTNPSPANYTLLAIATDDRGVSATSAVVSVTVNQPGIFDDFEPDIDLSQWSAFGGVLGSTVIATNYGGSVSGTRSLWFGAEANRFAQTRGVNAVQGGLILFQLRLSNGGGQFWEQADLSGEGVVLEYSINSGSTWVNIGTFDTAGANYTQNWTPEQFAIPAGAQGTNVMFRWRQLSNSGSCCDHWAIDDVQILVGPTPPAFSAEPRDQFAVLNGTASFTALAFGSSPLSYQWRFFGTNLPNQTNATLNLSGVTTNQAGPYSVVVTNPYGKITSSNGVLNIIQGNTAYFKVTALTADNVATMEHYQLTGYDPVTGWYGRGGIAVSSSQVLVNAGTNAARFSAANLSGGATVGRIYDGLVTDLRSETMYAFGTNATGQALSSQNMTVLTHLRELSGTSGAPTVNVIPLSSPIPLRGNYGSYGFFSGYGCAVVWAGRSVYHVSLPSGAVAYIGEVPPKAHTYSINWGFWGIAESTEEGISLVYVRDQQTIVRTYVPSGVTTNLATFSNLSFYNVGICFSVTRSRWYFDHQYNSQFAQNGTEVVGYADAQFTLSPSNGMPPTVLVAPQAAQALQGGRGSLGVLAIGDGVVAYQWRFNEIDLNGATGPGLVISNVQPAVAGNYSVVISNAFGAVTTSPVALSIALPPTITAQPQGLTVLAGTAVVFAVTNTGDAPFIYQWRFNGNDINGATNSSYTLNSSVYYHSGVYNVEVRNAVGVANSASATLVVHSPPFFNASATGRQLLRGMNMSLATVVDGSAPFYLQWMKDGNPVQGATNTTLFVTNVQPQDSGSYRLIATNIYGSITGAVAAIQVVELDDNSFAVKTLGTGNPILVNAYNVVGYYFYNGIAASAQRVFLNGYGTGANGPAGSFSAADLSGGFGVGGLRHGLVSDLRSRKVYSLGTGSSMIGYGGTVNSLIELDGITCQPTTNIITLSTNMSIQSGSAIFSGYGRIVLISGNNVAYSVAVPSGQVTVLGNMQSFNYNYANGFAYRGWCVAEQIGTNTYVVHTVDNRTIIRTRVPTGGDEVFAQFTDLGFDAGNIAVCLPRNRWYYNFDGASQFGGSGNNTLFSGSASFVYRMPTNIPPSILDQPVSRVALAGSTVNFSVLADGGSSLTYQWWWQTNILASQTNSTLTLTNVRIAAEGGYSVVISNTAGAITSSVATLNIDYGASSTNTVALLPLTGVAWKYNQTAAFFNNTWAATNFNDSSWQSGNAGLAVETLASLTPYIQTVLTLGRTSYYFRCSFNVPSNFPPGTVLRATTIIDDGALIYINGRLVQPIRMPSSGYNANTFAPNQAPFSGDAGLETFVWGASTNLVVGTNVIAAEVHQASANSSDIFWAMGLEALVPILNRPPVITNHPVSQLASPGQNVSFTVGASGTAPLSYQWLHEGTNLPGATLNSLNLSNVGRGDAGIYVARVRNPYDTAFSSNAVLTVLVPPIQILPNGLTFSAPGVFNLQFLGDTGAVYEIQASTNLSNWTPVGTVTNTTGSAEFQDPAAAGERYRFYRLRWIP